MTIQRRLPTLCGLVLLFGLSQVTSADAQYPRGRDPYSGGQYAYDNGFRQGLSQGSDDAQRGRNFNYRDDREYQRADEGYDRRSGSKGTYQSSYRRGYVDGYTQGYNRRGGNGRAVPRGNYPNYPSTGGYPNYPSTGGYPNYPNQGRYPDQNRRNGASGYGSQGYDVGYSEGYEKGLEDGQDRDRYDPLRHKWYREGDHGYNSRYGSKEQYKNAYREGFKVGYDQGYRDTTQYDRNGNRNPTRQSGRSRFPWPF